MSGAPFRDLFVELPAALFDVLKGAAEEAVKAASTSRPVAPSFASMLDHGAPHAVLCMRYGWERFSVSRAAASRDTEFGVRWPCKHRAVIDIPDSAMMGSTGDIINALDHAADVLGRPCSCMQRDR